MVVTRRFSFAIVGGGPPPSGGRGGDKIEEGSHIWCDGFFKKEKVFFAL